MNCRLCKQQMYSYFDSEVSAQAKQEIEHHITRCSSCRFQYELTSRENLILCDISHIPELSPDFNQRVLTAIARQSALSAQAKPTSKVGPNQRFNLPLWTRTAVAVVLLALCISVPGIMLPFQEEVAQKSDQGMPGPKYQGIIPAGSGSSSWGTVAANEAKKADTHGMVVNTSANIKATLPDVEDFALNGNPVADNDPVASSTVPPKSFEVARSDRQTASYAATNWSLKNVPTQYQLQYIANTDEHQTEYNYLTADETEKLTVKIVSVPVQNIAKESLPTPQPPPGLLSAPTEAPATVSREAQIGNNMVNLTLSGNLSCEELTRIASQIEIMPRN